MTEIKTYKCTNCDAVLSMAKEPFWCPMCGAPSSHLRQIEGYRIPAEQVVEVQRSAIEGLGKENEKLRELLSDAVDAASLADPRDWSISKRLQLIADAEELGIETQQED